MKIIVSMFVALLSLPALAQNSPTSVYGINMFANNSQGVSATNVGRIRYNSGTNQFEQSLSGASYTALIASIFADSPLSGDGSASNHLRCPSCLTGTPTAAGDLLYSTSGGQGLSPLAAVLAGRVLISNGVATAPTWSTSPLLSGVLFNANNSASLSGANQGTLLYNSNVQSFQSSINGGAYANAPNVSQAATWAGAQTYQAASTFSGGIAATGAAANDFSGSSGNFLTSTGTVSLRGPTVVLGSGDGGASPLAALLRAPDAAGANITGANQTIRGGLSTGSASGGDLVFQYVAPGGAGSTPNTPATALKLLGGTGALVLGGAQSIQSSDGTFVASWVGGGANVARLDIAGGLFRSTSTGQSFQQYDGTNAFEIISQGGAGQAIGTFTNSNLIFYTNSNSVASLNPAGDFTVNSGLTKVGRVIGNQGTALITSDFALSSGWGNTASVGSVTGTDTDWDITITANGTGLATGAAFDLTFKNGTWGNTPVCMVIMRATSNALSSNTKAAWSSTPTVLHVTINSVPTAGDTFSFSSHCIGVPL